MAKNANDDIFSSFIDKLQIVIHQIQDGEGRKENSEEFPAQLYWKRLGDVFKAFSHEATKLSMAFSKPPVPSNEACEGILNSVEKAVLALVSTFYALPKSQGLTLRRVVKRSVKQTVESLKSLVETIQGMGVGSSEQYQSTGTVWEETDRFSAMPKDNKMAVEAVLRENIPLVDDAVMELEEALDSGGGGDDIDDLDDFISDTSPDTTQNDHHWTETDRSLVGLCQGLLKCSKSLLKRTKLAVKNNGSCEREETVFQLDDLADHIERLSPVVDEFTMCLYPPMSYSTVKENAQQVHKVNTDMLTFLRHSHITTEDEAKWVDFLLKASLHNVSKIDSFTPGT